MRLALKKLDRFLTKMREQKSKKLKRRNKKRQIKAALNREKREIKFGGRSRVIDLLAKNATRIMSVPRRGPLEVKIPKNFSIIDNPLESLDLITSFAATLRIHKNKISKITFDHSNMETYDLAANGLLDTVAVEYNHEKTAKNARKQLRVEGKFPRSPCAVRFLRSLGIIKHMKVLHEQEKVQGRPEIKVLDTRNRSYEIAGINSDKKSRTTERFVEHIENCLAEINKALTEQAIKDLSNYVGEILGNAEDHPGFIDWTVQGYLDSDREDPVCEITIFNFGHSIAETLANLPENNYTYRQQIKPYINRHLKKGYFSQKFRKEDLLTIIALQRDVSRVNEDDTSTRGNGTRELIDFFQKVQSECCDKNNDEKARMAILSGSTFINFDGNHAGNEGVIAFNANNDLNELPDHKAVRTLGGLHFPGTIISIRFPLSVSSGSLVEEVQNDGKTRNDH